MNPEYIYIYREEIASCIESAYKRMLFTEAGNMLYFKKQEDLVAFAKERKWNHSPSDNYFYFKHHESIVEHEATAIPANDLVTQMIDYAKELEIIV